MSVLLKRRIKAVSDRISRLRDELHVLDHQLVQLQDEVEAARVRSLVSDVPGERAAYEEARRQHVLIERERDRQRRSLENLVRDRDMLLDRMADKSAQSSTED